MVSAGDESGTYFGDGRLSPTICDNGLLLCFHDRVPDLARDVGESGILGSLEGVGEGKRCSRPGEALDKERAWSITFNTYQSVSSRAQAHGSQDRAGNKDNLMGRGKRTDRALTHRLF
jgi:hypothetical protein